MDVHCPVCDSTFEHDYSIGDQLEEILEILRILRGPKGMPERWKTQNPWSPFPENKGPKGLDGGTSPDSGSIPDGSTVCPFCDNPVKNTWVCSCGSTPESRKMLRRLMESECRIGGLEDRLSTLENRVQSIIPPGFRYTSPDD